MDLDAKIKNWKNQEELFELKPVLKWFVQLASAINYLHTLTPKMIIHRDIKPKYFLFLVKLKKINLSVLISKSSIHYY